MMGTSGESRLQEGWGAAMALFGKLFEKKNCAICGKELGVFGKTKIHEAYLCKDCSGKLSPYFHGYSTATVDDIQAQLSYREANKADVAAFHVTRTLGNNTKVYLDEDQSKVIVTNASPSGWGSRNPDVFDFSQVTGCNYNVKESKTEIKRKDAEGKDVSYDPPRYDIDYDIYLTIYISHPYVSQIEFRVNDSRIETKGSSEYRQTEQLAREIKEALTGIRTEQRAAAAPKAPVTCPNCLATTAPDASGCCPYCGSSLADVVARKSGSQQEAREEEPRRDDERQDYRDERDYGEVRSQQTVGQTARPKVTGQAKADLRRRQNQ